jgi:hypothetical protein
MDEANLTDEQEVLRHTRPDTPEKALAVLRGLGSAHMGHLADDVEQFMEEARAVGLVVSSSFDIDIGYTVYLDSHDVETHESYERRAAREAAIEATWEAEWEERLEAALEAFRELLARARTEDEGRITLKCITEMVTLRDLHRRRASP